MIIAAIIVAALIVAAVLLAQAPDPSNVFKAWCCATAAIVIVGLVAVRAVDLAEHDDDHCPGYRCVDLSDREDGEILRVIVDDDVRAFEWTTEAELHERAGHVETTTTTTHVDTMEGHDHG
jgi:hypothetical protein